MLHGRLGTHLGANLHLQTDEEPMPPPSTGMKPMRAPRSSRPP